MTKTADARFAIKSWDEKPYIENADGSKMTRATVMKTLTGDIEGESRSEYTGWYSGNGTASFVALECVTGRLAGKTGTFVFQRTGVYEGGLAKESYSVVAGSATGELKGLRASGSSAVGHGLEHPFTFDYEFA